MSEEWFMPERASAWQISVEWRRWLVGFTVPHGGMIVWTVYVGPLSISYWPLA